jgi:hypothetical protein
MNERIRKLAEQTGIEFLDGIADNNSSREYCEAWIEQQQKFAELIVRECAGLSVNNQYANTKSEYYEGFNEALVYIGNKIKQHFGVEE